MKNALAKSRQKPSALDPYAPAYGVSGFVEPGNIDLNNRPVVTNPDGSVSTVRSMSVDVDGLEYLIPTVSEDGRLMEDQEAIDTFLSSGRHLGAFRDAQGATKWAEQLHRDQERRYTRPQ